MNTEHPKLSYSEKHRQLCDLARQVLETQAMDALGLDVQAMPINEESLRTMRYRWGANRRVDFNWDTLLRTLRKSHPCGLELALWSEFQLCSLSIARLSDRKGWLSITHIEACPAPDHPLKRKVVPLVIACAKIYATLIQASDPEGRLPVVRIMKPSKGAIPWYEQQGFSRLKVENGYTYLTELDV